MHYQNLNDPIEIDFSEPEDEAILTELSKVYFSSANLNISQETGYDSGQSQFTGSWTSQRSILTEIQDQLSQNSISPWMSSQFSQRISENSSSQYVSQNVSSQFHSQKTSSQIVQKNLQNSQLLVWEMDTLPLPSETCSQLVITDDLVRPSVKNQINLNVVDELEDRFVIDSIISAEKARQQHQQQVNTWSQQASLIQNYAEKHYLKIDALRISITKKIEYFAAYRATIPQLYRVEVIQKLDYLKYELEMTLANQNSKKISKPKKKQKRKIEVVKKSNQIIRYVSLKSIIYDNTFGLRLNEEDKRYKKLKPFQTQLYISLIEKLIQTVQSDTYTTSRDLFYKKMGQFETVARLQRFLKDIYVTLNLSHLDLHIIARPNGFVYGNLIYIDNEYEENIEVNCKMVRSGLHIPIDSRVIEFKPSDARFILVVEKQATFDHLAGSSIFELFNFIMITGCGYPNLSTREFLQKLWLTLKLPILALVDCDAFGFEIMANYRFGSYSMVHENNQLISPEISWLGVLPEEVKSLKLSGVEFSPFEAKRLDSIMKRDYIKQNKEWYHQLMIMKCLKMKVEIQELYNYSDSYLIDIYLPVKLSKGKWI